MASRHQAAEVERCQKVYEDLRVRWLGEFETVKERRAVAWAVHDAEAAWYQAKYEQAHAAWGEDDYRSLKMLAEWKGVEVRRLWDQARILRVSGWVRPDEESEREVGATVDEEAKALLAQRVVAMHERNEARQRYKAEWAKAVEYARQTRARREAYWRMVSVQDNPVATNESETSGDQQGQATSTTLAEGAGSVTEGDGDLALSGPLAVQQTSDEVERCQKVYEDLWVQCCGKFEKKDEQAAVVWAFYDAEAAWYQAKYEQAHAAWGVDDYRSLMMLAEWKGVEVRRLREQVGILRVSGWVRPDEESEREVGATVEGEVTALLAQQVVAMHERNEARQRCKTEAKVVERIHQERIRYRSYRLLERGGPLPSDDRQGEPSGAEANTGTTPDKIAGDGVDVADAWPVADRENQAGLDNVSVV